MLVRYDPFRPFTATRPSPVRRSHVPMDAVSHDQQVELRFDLPGVAPESIDVEVERNVLTVRAERTWSPAEGAEVLVRERSHGPVSRRVTLGESLDGNRLEATYDFGVLTVTVPVVEQAKPRKVEIHVGAPEAVEAGSSEAVQN
jgi:HSP20 family protein